MSATASAHLPTERGRLRRLSQLRAYTQNHLVSSSSSNGQRSYRNSLSSRVPWLSPSSNSAASTEVHASPSSESDFAYPADHSPAPTASSASNHRIGVELNSANGSSLPSRPVPNANSDCVAGTQGISAAQDRLPQPTESTTNLEFSAQETSDSRRENTSGANELVECSEPVTMVDSSSALKQKQKATIKFLPYQDPHPNTRPSLPFAPITRTLPSDSCVIHVGRYSERDGIPVANPAEPSDAPVGFKSKVVSRKHCEFLFINGQWHIKDVGSSSGTFLNHMRLSQPNMVSRLYAIKDGDIVQLGIDFRGGEEMIFRCVRVRIECNRSWQQLPNEFNKNTEALIKNLGKGDAADYAGCRECSICLGSVLRPYQCLFMAACAHVWHYKCISRLIHTPEYPMFQCPNCRAYTDLSAEVDDSNDVEEAARELSASDAQGTVEEPLNGTRLLAETANASASINGVSEVTDDHQSGIFSDDAELPLNIDNIHLHDGDESRAEAGDTDKSENFSSPSPVAGPSEDIENTAGIDVPGRQSLVGNTDLSETRPSYLRSGTPEENPMTPRNDSGPLAFDGRAGMPRHFL